MKIKTKRVLIITSTIVFSFIVSPILLAIFHSESFLGKLGEFLICMPLALSVLIFEHELGLGKLSSLFLTAILQSIIFFFIGLGIANFFYPKSTPKSTIPPEPAK